MKLNNGPAVKILPLGDSITEGVPVSYRHHLWKLLIDADFSFDFIGTMQDNQTYDNYKRNKWDEDHEGHLGLTTRMLNEQMEDWLPLYTPDIALIHLGTNDIAKITIGGYWGFSIDLTVNAMREIIEKLRAKNPDMEIYLAQILPLAVQEANQNITINRLNREFAKLAEEFTDLGLPVTIVDMNTDFTDFDLEDGVHPNTVGAKKMAEKWAEAILQ